MPQPGEIYSWTQPCCERCFDPVKARTASRLLDPPRETCALCGSVADTGLYIRVDPATVPHPTLERDQ